MFNLDDIANENNEDHNKKWSYIPDHPYRILIIRGPGSEKTNALLNLIKKKIVTTLLIRFICMLKA